MKGFAVLALAMLPSLAVSLVIAPAFPKPLSPAMLSSHGSTRTATTSMQAPKIRPPSDNDDGSPSVNPNEDTVDFEFDATTVVALLGAAIAFNFFVVANL